jgi:hypothetical protein
MSKKRADLRIAVGSQEGARSSVWRIWSKNDQVYVSSGSMGGVEKLSFHTPLLCRKAFTKEFGTPHALTDRATMEWLRAETPAAGSGKASCVLVVGFPTNYLSTPLQLKKQVAWIAPAPAGMTAVIELVFTRDDATTLASACQPAGRTVVSYSQLSNGEAYAILGRVDSWPGKDIRVPASHHEGRDLIISTSDPGSTSRPVRLTMYSNPKNGDALEANERGGYWLAPPQVAHTGTFSRSTVLHYQLK